MNSKNNSTNLSNFKNSLEKELKKLKSKLDEAQKTSDIQESSYKHKINYYHNRISDLYTYVEVKSFVLQKIFAIKLKD